MLEKGLGLSIIAEKSFNNGDFFYSVVFRISYKLLVTALHQRHEIILTSCNNVDCFHWLVAILLI